MTESRKLARNTILIAISRFSNQFLAFIMLPFYTTWLTKSEYGLVDIILTYGALIAPLVMLNMDMAVFRYLVDIRKNKNKQAEIITNSVELVLVASAIALAVFILVDAIVDFELAFSMALYFFSVAFGSLVLNVTRGLGHIKSFAIAGVVQGVAGVIFTVILVHYANLGPQGILVGTALGSIIPAIVLLVKTRMYSMINIYKRSVSVKKELLGYSLPLVPNSILGWVFNVSDRTILFLAVSAAANGVYAISNKFAGVLGSMWGVFYMSWSETAALNIDKPGRDKFFSFVGTASFSIFGSLAFIGVPATAVVFPFMINNSFHEALLYVPLLMFANFLNAVIGFYSAIYLAKKLTKQVMYTSLIAAIINIALTIALVGLIQIWAATIATFLAYGTLAIYRHYDMKKYVTISYDKLVIVKVIAIYVFVSVGYYVAYVLPSGYWINIVSLTFAIIAAYWLNRTIIKKLAKTSCRMLKLTNFLN